MKIGIIGAGAVGSACLTALVQRRVAREIVVVNRDRKKAKGLVTDVPAPSCGTAIMPI
jgi:L-lactate dehydrogenase